MVLSGNANLLMGEDPAEDEACIPSGAAAFRRVNRLANLLL
jgi:hypothetical protein